MFIFANITASRHYKFTGQLSKHNFKETPKARIEMNKRSPIHTRTDDMVPEKSSTDSGLQRELKLLAMFSLFAIIGVLARKGLTVLTSYDGSFLGGVVWANFAACIIMGIADATPKIWFNDTEKKNILLYVGITTGFCGTFSSFASMILESFVQSADVVIGKHYNFPNAAYGIMEALSVLITQMAISVAGFKFGANLVHDFGDILSYEPKTIKLLENITAIVGIALWITVICLIKIENWRSWIFSCIVSPLACWLRYYISKKMNTLSPSFPFGTFTVNVVATGILAVLNVLNRGTAGSGGVIISATLSCHMIQGLDDGFCGTLSTVSTFVNELNGLKVLDRWRYALVSIVVSYIIMLLILGSYNWSVGLTDPVCS